MDCNKITIKFVSASETEITVLNGDKEVHRQYIHNGFRVGDILDLNFEEPFLIKDPQFEILTYRNKPVHRRWTYCIRRVCSGNR